MPVVAAGSILGQPLSRAYRRYWGRSKGYLALVAEVAARFPDEGAHLAGELLARLPRLPASEQEAVQLHLAALGLLDKDPWRWRSVAAPGGRRRSRRAGRVAASRFGRHPRVACRGPGGLLAQAGLIAQRTTAFVASNPFAAVLEAMSAESLGGVGDLAELLDRAVELKIAIGSAGTVLSTPAVGR